MRTRWITIVALVAFDTLAPRPALAQPVPRDRRQPNERRPAPPDNQGPREAPPPARAEKREAARAGFVWIDGEWDWRGNKYEWVAGHWERERANKRWRPSRWEQKDGVYRRVPGAWEDGAPSTPPPVANDRPRQPPPPPRAEKREGARAGFVWIDGEWDWRGGKYEWVAGHWERERANKRWRASRWEQRDGAWTRTPGDWEDGGAAPPPVANDDRPRQPPPPPRSDPKEPARAGFVWIDGEWDWRGGKYEWVAGHWERERANKRWRPSRWEQRDGAWTRTPGDWEDGGGSPPPIAGGPRDAPPPPRPEKPEAARPGFVWIAGEWDWRGDKYEWVAGHWERERAGKRWRTSRWEQRDGRWTRTPGDWEDGVGGPRPTTGPRPPRRDWKIERPVVSSYWPAKGKPGARIVIRGRNFPNDANVLWGGKQIRGVKVTADSLIFAAPADATSGLLAVNVGRGRPLAVGNFEVAASFDAEAERKRLEDEARRRAEAQWADRQRQLAKDKAAREAAVRERWEDRQAKREQRRAERLAEIQGRYARAFLADAETQGELNLHAQRVAELERMTDIAEIRNDAKLAVRIEVLRARETERHDQRMVALDAAFRAGGGAP
jgi:hypothetical protein